MFIGGAERALLGLLDAIDKERYEVSLFLYRHEGEFMTMIPANVNVLPSIPAYTALDAPIRSLMRSRKWFLALNRILAKYMLIWRCRVVRKKASAFNTMSYISEFLLPFLPEIDGEYDLAINFLGSNDILLKRISAKVKVGWVHTDYSIYNQHPALDNTIWKRWGEINYIANVSEDCTRVFKQCFPFLSDKCITIENLLSPSFVRKGALEFDVSNDMPTEFGVTNICSVGRLCQQKNFDVIPEVVQLLNELGYKVKWYLVGGGPDESLIREKIKESQVENQVVLLGEKLNPYPYINSCNIYVQPSRFEGKAVTVREALILGKPVLITDYSTSASQLEDGVDGLVCHLSVDGIARGIRALVEEQELQDRLATTAASRDYSNKNELKKIERLVEGVE